MTTIAEIEARRIALKPHYFVEGDLCIRTIGRAVPETDVDFVREQLRAVSDALALAGCDVEDARNNALAYSMGYSRAPLDIVRLWHNLVDAAQAAIYDKVGFTAGILPASEAE